MKKNILIYLLILFTGSVYAQDTTPPTFSGIEFSPSSATNGEVVSVIIDANDDVSGIDRIQIDILNPEGGQQITVFKSLSSWTDLGNNRYSSDITINEFAISGDWYVSAVYIYDIAGNMFYESFTSTNSPYILSVTSTTPDTTPPTFSGIEFSPSSATNGEVVSVIIDANDDVSGIDRIQIDILNPEGGQQITVFKSLSSWTDLGNNRYSSDITINEFAISGDWYVSAVYIYDIAGNMFYESFTSTNSPYILSVTSTTPDTTPPTFSGIEFSPSSATNGEVVSVIIDANDDVSGIDRIQIDILNPEGGQQITVFKSLSSWTDLGNNRYSSDITINEFAISGDWYVSAVYIYDIAGNMFYESFTSTNSPYILSVSETASIVNVKQQKIILYPNPTTSIVTLQGDKQFDIEVYTLQGKKVMTLTGNSIDMSHLSSATYIVKALNKVENEEVSYKVVKN